MQIALASLGENLSLFTHLDTQLIIYVYTTPKKV